LTDQRFKGSFTHIWEVSFTQFDLDNITVMKKVLGESVFVKVKDALILLDNLEDFGKEELEMMHRTDELEGLS